MNASVTGPLKLYLSEVKRIPLLTRQEETALCRRVASTRRRLRRAMLASSYILRRALRLLQEVHDGPIRLDQTVDVAVNNTAEKARISKLLPSNLRTANALYRQNQRDFVLAADKRQPAVQRRRAWQRLVARRRTIAAWLEQSPLRRKHLQSIFQGLKRIAREMDDLRLRLDRHGSPAVEQQHTVALRRRLHRMVWATLETPSMLRRRVDHIAQLQRDYDAARQELAARNLRLVVSVANRYGDRGVSISDLVQEGNLGLLQATERFDPDRGCRFSTYAVWWIRHAVTSAVAKQSRTVRLSHHVIRKVGELHRVVGALAQQLGGLPNVEQTARAALMTEQEAGRILQSGRQPLSLDESPNGDEESTLGDVLPCPRQNDPSQITEHRALHRHLEESLDTLQHREREVIRLRFGLSDGVVRSQEEVGKLFRLSRERIRQIEQRALKNLRRTSHSRELRDFLDTPSSDQPPVPHFRRGRDLAGSPSRTPHRRAPLKRTG